MILTCPDCATRYFVDDARIGPQGRKVRCASCGTTWREGASAATPPPLSLQPVGAVAFPDTGDLTAVRERLARSPDVPKRLRAAAAEKRQTREAVAVGAVWAGLGAGVCALALVAMIFRTDVVHLMPATAGAYAFAQMPVNPTGLAIEGVQGGPGLQEGHAALTVSGVERNVETRPRAATPLRVLLLDKAGKHLANRVIAPQGALRPGETRPFTVSFLDPPLSAASFQVEFAFDAIKKGSPAPPKAAPVALKLHEPAATAAAKGPLPAPVAVQVPAGAKDATPLPAGSPYALPTAPPSPSLQVAPTPVSSTLAPTPKKVHV